MAALLLATSTGSEMCSCAIDHLSSNRWQQMVARTQ
jgi:hypothetical protein